MGEDALCWRRHNCGINSPYENDVLAQIPMAPKHLRRSTGLAKTMQPRVKKSEGHLSRSKIVQEGAQKI